MPLGSTPSISLRKSQIEIVFAKTVNGVMTVSTPVEDAIKIIDEAMAQHGNWAKARAEFVEALNRLKWR
jgi:hypothetical protein